VESSIDCVRSVRLKGDLSLTLEHVGGVLSLDERVVYGDNLAAIGSVLIIAIPDRKLLHIVVLDSLTEDESANAAETVDTDLDSHFD